MAVQNLEVDTTSRTVSPFWPISSCVVVQRQSVFGFKAKNRIFGFRPTLESRLQSETTQLRSSDFGRSAAEKQMSLIVLIYPADHSSRYPTAKTSESIGMNQYRAVLPFPYRRRSSASRQSPERIEESGTAHALRRRTDSGGGGWRRLHSARALTRAREDECSLTNEL